jgi:hypothetical protein
MINGYHFSMNGHPAVARTISSKPFGTREFQKRKSNGLEMCGFCLSSFFFLT